MADLEKDLDDLFQNGQQTTVVNTHPTLEQWQDGLHLRQRSALAGEKS